MAVLTAQIQIVSVSNLADMQHPRRDLRNPNAAVGLVARSNMSSKHSRKPQLAYIDPGSGIESANGGLPVEFAVVEKRWQYQLRFS
jgi:hypothetical protein